MSRLGLIDYGMGNLHSVQRGFERLGASVQTVHGAEEMEGCTALVLPGVGAFDPAMERLRQGGLATAISSWCAAGRLMVGGRVCGGRAAPMPGRAAGPGR